MELSSQSAATAAANRNGSEVPVADSAALLRGHRELLISHGSQTYRLRITASGKLILTK
ncbi:MAG: hemin uptake protein HemP [Pseudomonadota bacterium]